MRVNLLRGDPEWQSGSSPNQPGPCPRSARFSVCIYTEKVNIEEDMQRSIKSSLTPSTPPPRATLSALSPHRLIGRLQGSTSGLHEIVVVQYIVIYVRINLGDTLDHSELGLVGGLQARQREAPCPLILTRDMAETLSLAMCARHSPSSSHLPCPSLPAASYCSKQTTHSRPF